MESRNIEMPSNRELIREAFLQTISEEVSKSEGEKQTQNLENGVQPSKLTNISKIRNIQSQTFIKNEEVEKDVFFEEKSFESDHHENKKKLTTKYDNLFF